MCGSKNPTYCIVYQREYRKRKAAMGQSYQGDPAKSRARVKRYYESHKEKILSENREWARTEEGKRYFRERLRRIAAQKRKREADEIKRAVASALRLKALADIRARQAMQGIHYKGAI